MMITLLYMDMFPWAVLIVSARELAVDGLRLATLNAGHPADPGQAENQRAVCKRPLLTCPPLPAVHGTCHIHERADSNIGIQYFYQARHLLSDGRIA